MYVQFVTFLKVCTKKEQNALNHFLFVCTPSHVHTEQVTVMSAHMKIMKRWINRKNGQYKYVYTYMCSHCMQGEPSFMHTCRARLRGSKGAEVSRQCSLSLGPPLLSAELFFSLLDVLWHLGLPSLSLCLLYCLLMSLLVHSLSFSPCFTAT